jgi:hypothetical protein
VISQILNLMAESLVRSTPIPLWHHCNIIAPTMAHVLYPTSPPTPPTYPPPSLSPLAGRHQASVHVFHVHDDIGMQQRLYATSTHTNTQSP